LNTTQTYSKHTAILFCLSIYFCACNYTKHLTDNQAILKENKIALKLQTPIKYKGEFESSIATLINPQPNSHILDLGILPKYKLWRYNLRYKYYEKNDTDVKIVKRKVEKVVLVDSNAIARSRMQIRQFMINQGFFYASVESEIVPSGKRMETVNYKIDAGKSYTIKKVTHKVDKRSILDLIAENRKNSLLKEGDVFTNFKCGLERERLYKLLRNEGYYDFKTDNVSFTLDTIDKNQLKNLLIDPLDQFSGYDSIPVMTTQTDSIQVAINIQQTKDSTFDIKYAIDSVQVYLIDFTSAKETGMPLITNELDGIQFNYKTLPVNRKVITRNIFIKPGDIYNTKSIEATTNRLNQLNVFQFVNIQFVRRTDTIGKLVCKIILNTNPKMDFVGTTELSNSDVYYLGIGASITYRNRNLFHGANQLQIRLAPSIEYRNDDKLTGSKKFYNSGLNINLNTSITFPKFIVPFNQTIFNKKNKPFTTLGLNYSYLRRQKDYTIINVSSNFGYSWNETDRKTWKFSPAFLTLTFVPDTLLSSSFKEKISKSRYLRNTFKNNIIQGENVSFDYRSRLHGAYNSFSSFKINIEEAGSLLKGINSIYNSITKENIEPIAHYVRTEIDTRKYINFRKSQWVNRVNIGVGISFNDTVALPYLKQFSSGGPYSMRGWQVRRLGPGRSVDSAYLTSKNADIDRTGDLKFEFNTEYRFNLVKLFSGAIDVKGATFMDVGNIWLLRKSKDIVGGELDPAYFFHDLAVGAGAGIRFDFSFFVLRTDLGFKVKQPSALENYGFTNKELNFKKGVWAINFGYPF
jgi:outer membrane protein insertion porin family